MEKYNSYKDILSRAEVSPLMLSSADILEQLGLGELKTIGVFRDRANYILNITYPSLQLMPHMRQVPDFSQNPNRRFSLYVHVPFCTAECYYCHYYKEFRKPGDYVDLFLDGVSNEIDLLRQRFSQLNIESVYIGGGTPSYLTVDQIQRLLEIIQSKTNIKQGAEFSFEIHPESASNEKYTMLQSYGVNRLNIGVESFDDGILAAEHRRHNSQGAIEAYTKGVRHGFDNINLDLIYGLKDQTVSQWESNLDRLTELQPASATTYYLRLKQGAPEYKLWKSSPERFPTDYELQLMQVMNFQRMESELGYSQTPVDWYVRNDHFFHRYQDFNWRKTDDVQLLGVGPSAYSYIDGWQYYNVNDTRKWMQSVKNGELPIWRGEQLSSDEKIRRSIVLGIKMGIPLDYYTHIHGVDIVQYFANTWAHLEQIGLVKIENDRIDLTYTGKLFADEVGQQFYSHDVKKRMSEVDPTLLSTTWSQFNT